MQLAAASARAIAIDLPGIGESTSEVVPATKSQLAAVVRGLVSTLGLQNLTLVGHDAGGMITYSYMRQYADLARAVILDVVVPGVDPWEEVRRNSHVWHFAFHAVARLPERLVQGRQAEYFDYFFDVLSADPSRIDAASRRAHVQAYATDAALSAGFGWYRAFGQDAAENRALVGQRAVSTPLLYLRGAKGPSGTGGIQPYLEGFRRVGVEHLVSSIVPGAGHFCAEEAPEETWRLIAEFAGLSH